MEPNERVGVVPVAAGGAPAIHHDDVASFSASISASVNDKPAAPAPTTR